MSLSEFNVCHFWYFPFISSTLPESFPSPPNIKFHLCLIVMTLEIILIAAPLLFSLFWKIRSIMNCLDRPKTEYLRSAELCRRMLAQESFESRAKANARLRQTFEIENAFTTTDLTYKQQFVAKVKNLLRSDNDGWKKFTNSAQAAFDATLEDYPEHLYDETGIRLVYLVRSVVFTAAVNKVFRSNSDLSLHVESVCLATLYINSLWIESKVSTGSHISPLILTKVYHQSQEIAPDLESSQRKLYNELRRVIFDMNTMSDITPRSNPLNLILPSYEAIWGVVLRITIEVLYRNHPQSAVWQEALIRFVQAPTPANFKAPSSTDGDEGMTVKAIVNEGLRLYPPTRRIYRQHPDREDWKVAADVEHLHRDPKVWGKHAKLFRPSRWLGPDGYETMRRQKGGDVFMPFGYGPLACPARHEAGPLMVGIFVGILVKNLSEKGISIKAADAQSRISGTGPLKMGRDIYGGLGLQIPEPEQEFPCT